MRQVRTRKIKIHPVHITALNNALISHDCRIMAHYLPKGDKSAVALKLAGAYRLYNELLHYTRVHTKGVAWALEGVIGFAGVVAEGSWWSGEHPQGFVRLAKGQGL